MASSAKGFEGFEPLFGEAAAEWENGGAGDGASIRRLFIFYAHPLDKLRLEIVASDFCSDTLHRVLTVDELEDLRDDIGLGGSWVEFVDYLTKCLSSDGVKLLFSDGAMTAKLIAHKSKGMPRIVLLLNRLVSSSASGSISSLAFALYRAFKDRASNAIEERDHRLQVAGLLSSEKEKNEELQKQLDSYSFKNKRKVPKAKVLEKESTVDDASGGFDKLTGSEIHHPTEMPSSKESLTTKVNQRIVPGRRVKARGARLQDTEDDINI